MVSFSQKPDADLLDIPAPLIPQNADFSGCPEAVSAIGFLRHVGNTVICATKL